MGPCPCWNNTCIQWLLYYSYELRHFQWKTAGKRFTGALDMLQPVTSWRHFAVNTLTSRFAEDPFTHFRNYFLNIISHFRQRNDALEKRLALFQPINRVRWKLTYPYRSYYTEIAYTKRGRILWLAMAHFTFILNSHTNKKADIPSSFMKCTVNGTPDRFLAAKMRSNKGFARSL